MILLKNYKAFLHLVTLVIFFVVPLIFTPQFFDSVVFPVVLLISAYFVTNFTISYLEIDEFVKSEIDKMEKEKSDK